MIAPSGDSATSRVRPRFGDCAAELLLVILVMISLFVFDHIRQLLLSAGIPEQSNDLVVAMLFRKHQSCLPRVDEPPCHIGAFIE